MHIKITNYQDALKSLDFKVVVLFGEKRRIDGSSR